MKRLSFFAFFALLCGCCMPHAAHAQRISSLPRTNTLQGAAASNLVMVTALEGGTNGSFAYTFPDFAALMEPYYTGVSGVSVSQLNTTSNALVNYANGTTNASIVRQTQLTAASNALYSAIGTAAGSNFVVSTHGTAIITGEVSAASAVFGTSLNSQGDTTLSGSSGIAANRVLYLDIAKKVQTSSGVTPTELEYLDNVTSAIQTQLDSKPSTAQLNTASNALVTILTSYDTSTSNALYALILGGGITANTATNIAQYFATNSAIVTSNQLVSTLAPKASPTFTGSVTLSSGTANELVAFDASKVLVPVTGVSATEAGYLDGVTSLIQSQLDSKASTTVLNTSSNAIVALITGGTNNPVTLSAGTLTLIASQTARYYTNSSGSFPFTFSGTPNASSRVSLAVSNTSASTIYVTNTSGIYDPRDAAFVTTLAIPAQSQSTFHFRRNATSGWELESVIEKPLGLAAGVNTTLSTNSGNVSVIGAFSFSTNGSSWISATQLVARSGIVISNDAAGTASFHVSASTVGSISTNANQFGSSTTLTIKNQPNLTNPIVWGVISETNWINVRAYGAVGDGSTDDAAAFKAAFTNPLVYVPAGRYLIGSAMAKTNGIVRGDGPARTVLLQNFNGILINTITPSQRVSFYDMEFDGQGGSDYSSGGAVGSRYALQAYGMGLVNFERLHFRNYSGDALYIDSVVSTDTSRDSVVGVFNCYFSNCWSGISLKTSEYSRVIGNAIDECSYGLILGAANAHVSANRIIDCYVGINASQIFSSVRGHNMLVGNSMNHCTYPLVAKGVTGLTVTGNELMGNGTVWFTNASGINFIGNLCELNGFRFEGGTYNAVKNNTFYSGTTPTFTHNYAGATSYTRVEGNANELGASVPVSPTLTLAAGAWVTNAMDKVRVVGSGGAVTLTSTPSVNTNSIPDGTVIRILGTDDTNTITVQDEGTLTGSKCELGATTRVLGLGDALILQYDYTLNKWFEIGFFNN